jgi:hypothetical protein
LHRFAGLVVEPVDIVLRAPRQIDLTQARRAEIQDARSQHIALAADAAGDIAPIAQCRNQMMAGRDVQAGPRADLGELRLAAGVGDDIENQKGAIERLDAALVPPHRRTSRHHAVRFLDADIHRRAPRGCRFLLVVAIERHPAGLIK